LYDRPDIVMNMRGVQAGGDRGEAHAAVRVGSIVVKRAGHGVMEPREWNDGRRARSNRNSNHHGSRHWSHRYNDDSDGSQHDGSQHDGSQHDGSQHDGDDSDSDDSDSDDDAGGVYVALPGKLYDGLKRDRTADPNWPLTAAASRHVRKLIRQTAKAVAANSLVHLYHGWTRPHDAVITRTQWSGIADQHLALLEEASHSQCENLAQVVNVYSQDSSKFNVACLVGKYLAAPGAGQPAGRTGPRGPGTSHRRTSHRRTGQQGTGQQGTGQQGTSDFAHLPESVGLARRFGLDKRHCMSGEEFQVLYDALLQAFHLVGTSGNPVDEPAGLSGPLLRQHRRGTRFTVFRAVDYFEPLGARDGRDIYTTALPFEIHNFTFSSTSTDEGTAEGFWKSGSHSPCCILALDVPRNYRRFIAMGNGLSDFSSEAEVLFPPDAMFVIKERECKYVKSYVGDIMPVTVLRGHVRTCPFPTHPAPTLLFSLLSSG
jgi:hypothetical protein